ncbi:MAG: SGNH/GDSL hydrolase family protein [Kyrpidia sp.]|nr:SGNH/GDSL hydrolase family protein [Kyrpidia sp.]
MGAEPLRYVALGDSITVGKGVPRGAAYPDVLFRRLQHSPECRMENLAISGLTSGELLTLVKNRFASRLASATCITMSIGGNDLLRRLLAGHWNPYSYLSAVQRLWQTVPAIIGELRRCAPEAHVFVLGLYNPYPVIWRGHRAAEWVIRRINREYRSRIAAARVTFIDLADVLPMASASWLCDGIHPSVGGHRRIAAALLDAYRSAAVRPTRRPAAVVTNPAPAVNRSVYPDPPDEAPKSAS